MKKWLFAVYRRWTPTLYSRVIRCYNHIYPLIRSLISGPITPLIYNSTFQGWIDTLKRNHLGTQTGRSRYTTGVWVHLVGKDAFQQHLRIAPMINITYQPSSALWLAGMEVLCFFVCLSNLRLFLKGSNIWFTICFPRHPGPPKLRRCCEWTPKTYRKHQTWGGMTECLGFLGFPKNPNIFLEEDFVGFPSHPPCCRIVRSKCLSAMASTSDTVCGFVSMDLGYG